MKTQFKNSLCKLGLLICYYLVLTVGRIYGQSQFYIYLKPDGYLCNGEIIIHPKCVDVPPIAQFTIQYGSQIIGPTLWNTWGFSDLCYSGSTENLLVTATDSANNTYVLIDAQISLDPYNPFVTYNPAQLVANPLTVIELQRLPAVSCNGELLLQVTGGVQPIDIYLMNTFNNDSIVFIQSGNQYLADNLCSGSYNLFFRDAFTGPCLGNITYIGNSNDTTASGGFGFSNPYFIHNINIDPLFCMLTTSNTCALECNGTVDMFWMGGDGVLYTQIYHLESNQYFVQNNITDACYGNYYGEVVHYTGQTAVCHGLVDSTYIHIQFAVTPASSANSSDGSVGVLLSTNGSEPVSYLWSNGANTPVISGLNPGNYCVTVSCAEGCEATSCTQLGNLASLNDASINSAPYFVFQPDVNRIIISNFPAEISSNIKFSIFDMQGRMVIQGNKTILPELPISIDLPNLSAGSYLLQVTGYSYQAAFKFLINK